MRFRCPHCGSVSKVRSSEIISPTFSYLYVHCTDLECGHTWRVDAEAAVTLSPSAKPSSDVFLKLSPHIQRQALKDQMDHVPDGDHKLMTPFQPGLDL